MRFYMVQANEVCVRRWPIRLFTDRANAEECVKKSKEEAEERAKKGWNVRYKPEEVVLLEFEEDVPALVAAAIDEDRPLISGSRELPAQSRLTNMAFAMGVYRGRGSKEDRANYWAAVGEMILNAR
jgi:hypothetical protein